MDSEGPVKVVVRRTGLAPNAKTVDLDSLRRIIERTQNKQLLSTSRPVKAHPVLTEPEDGDHETKKKVGIVSDTGNRGTECFGVSPAVNTTFIKKEPIENLHSGSTLENTTDLCSENEMQSPPKRLKGAEQEEDDVKGSYSCCFCQFSTKSAKDYRVHIASHLKNKVLNCKSCPFSTAKISAYNDHLRVAHTQKLPTPSFFHCSVCNFRATKVDALLRHRTITGHSDDRPMQKCKLCEYTDRNMLRMVEHISAHKPNEQLAAECEKCDNPEGKKTNDDTPHSDDCPEKMFPFAYTYKETVEKMEPPKSFTCTFCDFKSEELLFLLEHIKAHMKLSADGNGDIANLHPFSCTMCDYRCTKPNKVVLHMKTHGPGIVFRCKDCPYESKLLHAFKFHRKSHEGNKVFPCFVCYKKFVSQEGLQSHMTKHSKQKPFTCHLCDFICVTKDTLLQHIKNHSKKKVTMIFFPCPLCSNKYSTSASLKAHLSNHGTDTKPYQCDFCDYSCYTSELLRVHVQTHSGSNRFRCEICLLNYPSESKLKAHIRDHLTFDKPLKCSVCNTSFSSQAQLNRHLPIHSGRADPFVCFLCPQSFPTLKSRRNHLLMSHKIENEAEWREKQPIVVRPAGTEASDCPADAYGYIEEDLANDSDSEEEAVHPGQHQFIGYPAMDTEYFHNMNLCWVAERESLLRAG